MNKTKQKIAIAEACGLSDIGKIGEQLMHGGTGIFLDVPDYLNDLNAMHEAEFTRIIGNDEHEFNYRCALDKIMGHDRSIIHFATASQRAEAFLRTIGKWEDE